MNMQTHARNSFSRAARQGGAVLITGIIFLVVVTMVVLAVLRSGTLEEKMARNARDRQVALQAAESVLREAEATFSGPPFDPYDPSAFTSACTNGYCFKPAATATWQAIDWSSTALTRTFAAAGSQISGLNTQPRYIVEIIVPPIKGSSVGQCENGLAKVTARGVGNGNAASLVQSTVRFKVFTNICDF